MSCTASDLDLSKSLQIILKESRIIVQAEAAPHNFRKKWLFNIYQYAINRLLIFKFFQVMYGAESTQLRTETF